MAVIASITTRSPRDCESSGKEKFHDSRLGLGPFAAAKWRYHRETDAFAHCNSSDCECSCIFGTTKFKNAKNVSMTFVRFFTVWLANVHDVSKVERFVAILRQASDYLYKSKLRWECRNMHLWYSSLRKIGSLRKSPKVSSSFVFPFLKIFSWIWRLLWLRARGPPGTYKKEFLFCQLHSVTKVRETHKNSQSNCDPPVERIIDGDTRCWVTRTIRRTMRTPRACRCWRRERPYRATRFRDACYMLRRCLFLFCSLR